MDQEELRIAGNEAKKASSILAVLSAKEKNELLLDIHDELMNSREALLSANAKDLEKADGYGLSASMKERLALSEKKINAMAEGVAQLVHLPDPCGRILSRKVLSNGLEIIQTSVPFGVIAMIYESRPNVTVDAAALCLKSGNACILRGGKEAHYTNEALTSILQKALQNKNLPSASVISILDPERSLVNTLLTMRDVVDLAIPRGGAGLIRFVVENSTVPVIETGSGICHTYVDQTADMTQAIPIILNAKTQRPSVCNAMETLLIHREIAPQLIPPLFRALREKNVEIRGDEAVHLLDPTVTLATHADWATEYGDLILSVKIVDSLEEAISHIHTYGTRHSECIISRDPKAIQTFMNEVDAACVYSNASTRFTDGFEFGFGAEIGISTQKLHVRGPMGLDALVTYKYKIFGNGQVRV